jgi:hypothetical protein
MIWVWEFRRFGERRYMVLVVAVPPFFWRTANVVSMDDRKHWKNHSLLASMLVPRSTPACVRRAAMPTGR